MPKEQAKLISTILNVTGTAFLLLSVFCYMSPESAAGFLDTDQETTKMMSYGLIFVAFADFISAHIILSRAKN